MRLHYTTGQFGPICGTVEKCIRVNDWQPFSFKYMGTISETEKFDNQKLMKIIVYILALIFLGGLLQHYLPWWTLPLAAFLLAPGFRFSPGEAFLAGFLGAALLWGGNAAYFNALNDGILAARMGGLFGGLGPDMMVLLTAFFGGLFGGLGAWTGSLARQAFFSSDKLATKA